MFDIGGFELLLVAFLGLIVIGPKRLPEVVRTISLWVGRLHRGINNIKRGVEKEFQLDEIRRQLHNEEIMQQLNTSKQAIEETVSDVAQIDHDFEPLPRDSEQSPPSTENEKE